MRPCTPAVTLVGRSADVASLQNAVHEVVAGQGGCAWVEGEPGVGKSSLVVAVLESAEARGCRNAVGAADELGLHSPLRAVLDCMGISARSEDARHAEILQLLHGGTASETLSDPIPAAIERLLALVDDLCATQPMIMVVDDVQWADELSLVVWHRLAQSVEQIPLLLIAVCRPLPQRPEVDRLRHSMLSSGGIHLPLHPLPEEHIAELVSELVGAPAGPRLQQLARHAAGNPLYVRVLVEALCDEGKIDLGASGAELAATEDERVPASLASVINHRLGFLPPEVLGMLGAATMLGTEFAVTDLAAVLGTPVSALLTGLRQATAAAVIAPSGDLLRFRHPLIRQALLDALPSALRIALHRQVAQVLAEARAPVERVAEQLLAVPVISDTWTLEWLARHAPELTRHATALAADLLQRVVDAKVDVGSPRHEVIVSCLALAYFRRGQLDHAEKYAWKALARGKNAEIAGEMRWTLARLLFSSGRDAQAREVTGQALRDSTVPLRWKARFQALSAMSLRADVGDLDGAEKRAHDALGLAEEADDALGIGYALCVLWLVKSVRRDHLGALESIDRALSVLGEGYDREDLRSWALDNRLFTLQNLDRLSETDLALRKVLTEARESGDPARLSLQLASAVHDYWRGRWDDALTTLDSIAPQGPEASHFGMRERSPFLLYHGVAALIAGHRDAREAAHRHLDAGLSSAISTISAWENFDFLLAEQALDAEREGAPEQALELLTQLLEPRPGQMTLVHQWLPDLVRLALALGEKATAQAALDLCSKEANREASPARATFAAQRCHGLLKGDAAPLMAVAEHYATVGRPVERAQTLEDAALLMAGHGRLPQARKTMAEAIRIYGDLGAEWDIRRADTRGRKFGLRRGVRGKRSRASFGWEALSPTELKVARLVAEGKSNPEVAADLFLSRRTVQTHVSHILAKIGGRSRVEIATEAMRHPENAS
ncbi:helix-turn-helix transcriptional regulator [Streptomyces lydicus]|uniref:helix-turn-helix transcriptional regulator n=1 Tax=Streptomyces lydicus TaxID=47763 RepID=UPI0036EEEE18